MHPNELFIHNISSDPEAEYRLDFPTRDFVTFRAGGSADIFVTPKTLDSLKRTVSAARLCGIDYICVGGGSNLLVRDGGYRGAMICVRELKSIEAEGELLSAECGARLSAVVSFALDRSLRGLEFAGGIPGTVGGGVYMNAGAYGGEIKDALLYADVINAEGEQRRVPALELGLGYRRSAIMDTDLIVTSAAFSLYRGDADDGRKLLKELNARRREKQPTDMPSAGSTFKRPVGGYAAALIEQAGLKGEAVGGAEVSRKHAGFVVNTGSATAKDIESLTELIKKRVFENSGTELQLEVKIIGEG